MINESTNKTITNHNQIDEGYIKYNCIWEKASPPSEVYLTEINHWRQKLFELELIGVYKDSGIGYGNISTRHPKHNDQFIITATQTGGLEKLSKNHYSLVTACSIEENRVYCRGLQKASSEALTHYIIYNLNNRYNAVMHIHHHKMWKQLQFKLPTTPRNVTYGTPDIAFEIKRMYDRNILESRIIIMAGHEDGVITFGNNMDECGDVLLHYLSYISV